MHKEIKDTYFLAYLFVIHSSPAVLVHGFPRQPIASLGSVLNRILSKKHFVDILWKSHHQLILRKQYPDSGLDTSVVCLCLTEEIIRFMYVMK